MYQKASGLMNEYWCEYLERKFGGSHQYDRIAEALVYTGRAEGITFALDKIKRVPNSANSHRLVRLAHTLGRQNEERCPEHYVGLCFACRDENQERRGNRQRAPSREPAAGRRTK